MQSSRFLGRTPMMMDTRAMLAMDKAWRANATAETPHTRDILEKNGRLAYVNQGPATTPKVTTKERGAKMAKGGAASMTSQAEAHDKAIDETGVGVYYGDHSNYKSMNAEERKAWVANNKVEGSDPAMPKESSCIGWAMEHVKAAYEEAGMGARWRQIERSVYAKGSKGTDLAKELAKDGWTPVYFNPDVKNPNDGSSEHPYSAALVKQGKGYYGIKVKETITNYRPTEGEGTKLDTSGTDRLAKIPFYFGVARGGTHTFVGGKGDITDFHWDAMPNDKGAITTQSLADFEWNSGLIMVPPGTW